MKNSISSFYVKLWNSPTFTTWAGFFSKAIYGIVLLPIVSIKLSTEELSVWLLLNIFIGLQMLGDLGFGSTFSRAISHAYGGALKINIFKNSQEQVTINKSDKSNTPNWNLINKLYSTTTLLYFILSIVLIIIMGILGYFSLKIPIDSLLNESEGWYSFIIVLTGIFINFNGSKYRIFLQGINKVALIQRNQSILGILTVISSVIVVLLTNSLIALIFIQQIGTVIAVIVFKYLSKKNYPKSKPLLFYENKIDFELIKSIFPIAWKSWLGVLMSYGVVQVSGIIVAQFGNSAQTASYLLSIKLIDLVKNFSNAPFYSQIPYMNQLFLLKDKKSLLTLAFERIKYSLLILTVSLGIIIIFGNDILTLLSSNVKLVNNDIFIILLLAAFVERYGALHIQLYSLSNNIIWHIANGVTGTLYLVITYCLINLGTELIFAFSIALLISYIVFYSWYASYKSYAFYKMNFIKTEYQTTLIPIIVMAIIIIINHIK